MVGNLRFPLKIVRTQPSYVKLGQTHVTGQNPSTLSLVTQEVLLPSGADSKPPHIEIKDLWIHVDGKRMECLAHLRDALDVWYDYELRMRLKKAGLDPYQPFLPHF